MAITSGETRELIYGYFIQIDFLPKRPKPFEVTLYKGDRENLDVEKKAIVTKSYWTLNEAMDRYDTMIHRIQLTRKLPKRFETDGELKFFTQNL